MGLFITFEGPDGSGKSTQIELLAEHLGGQGHQVLCAREPGGTSIGSQIRGVLHDVANTEMDPRAEVLLYSASRAQLVAQVIQPALAQGKVVLCDRYADSTFAYQGYGHGLDLDALRQLTHFATRGLKPDLTIYLDLPVEEGLRRKQTANRAGAGEWNRMDRLALDFHRRVRAGYIEMIRAEPERWLVIDAAQSIQATQAAICARLEALLAGTRPGR
ncbi:MAG: dTMP kinase [Anaerolineae bacterium]